MCDCNRRYGPIIPTIENSLKTLEKLKKELESSEDINEHAVNPLSLDMGI